MALDSSAVVTQLNRLLAFELTSIDQYTAHSRRYEDMGLNKLYERINQEIDDERLHADLLIRRMLFLGGRPDMDKREPHTIADDVPTMLSNDLELERNNAKTLREVIDFCEQEGDFVTRTMLVGILQDTEEDHAYWLRQQLELIDRLGLELYLQAQM
ncbi:bacterioferritin [Pseudidiomarina terrestris]|uniref:Bacterioferritin n=1 Tax=Pseudidiomarina terrestris TaxID=2820060 RepID=A0AAW7QXR7_9GAMM|nr:MULTISPECIES: bacterioferritin [unclassified Pseudidiomarina]MDN7124648.1 bacterioferritin [Pseudidiomarina sp. 1APP75-32.1]MDN7126804.1 bacterioferritin [Pseudidiomarina sp. 1APR75-33.1]MDN7129061.1 bacterioferritin [Pseudidiomarina sp. 1APR75-15]MDN7134675.1 bacterioferritin [Pseudidiomarina sp. 1ASP75-5]MDN7136655.1 bacterioferritin [Pseudidiomarina sp. 1ASP75-14]